MASLSRCSVAEDRAMKKTLIFLSSWESVLASIATCNARTHRQRRRDGHYRCHSNIASCDYFSVTMAERVDKKKRFAWTSAGMVFHFTTLRKNTMFCFSRGAEAMPIQTMVSRSIAVHFGNTLPPGYQIRSHYYLLNYKSNLSGV